MPSVRSGVTRHVILIGRYVVKFPNIRNGWVLFLLGLLSNVNEAKFTTLAEHFSLCPTIWAMWGGWLNIQPRCNPLTDQEWMSIEHLWEPGESDWNGFSCDFKRDNFGTLNGLIVLFDCGELT